MDENEILQGMVKGFTDSLLEEGKSLFKGLTDEAKQFINKGLKEYLEKQKGKYSTIKTLLRGSTPVPLYDIYYPLKLDYHGKTIKTDNVSTIFKIGNYITIIGDAGSGKSTLAKHLFLNAIQDKYAIPLLIELRYLNEFDGDVDNFICEKIFENEISQNDEILVRLLKKGKFLFFLDGFDEIVSSVRNKIVKNLNSFINKYHNNKFVLTSRPYSNIEHLPLFYNLNVLELSKTDIDAFIDKQLPNENEIAQKIKESIKENKASYITSFLKNPLLLSIYILTYQSNALIPTKKYIFYRRIIQVLFSEHDSKTKLGYTREIYSKLTQDQFEEILKRFCFLSYFENRFNFDYEYVNKKLTNIKDKVGKYKFDNDKFINDMKISIALWLDDNGMLSFAHRSLQEYFTAAFIKSVNEEHKIKIYDKIKNKSSVHRFGEVENLLSLLEEMDYLQYLKYYYIPLLTEFKNHIRDKSKIGSMKKLIKLCGIGVAIPRDKTNLDLNRIPLYLHNPDFYRFYYLLENKTTELFTLFRDIIRPILKANNIEQKYSIKTSTQSEYHLELYHNFDKIFDKEAKKNLYKSLTNIIKYIDEQVSNAENEINTSIQSDKDLIEMI